MILEKIRAHTAECHNRLEERLDLFQRVNSIETYTTLLGRWNTYLQATEIRATNDPEWVSFGLNYPMYERVKKDSLNADLNFLKVHYPESKIDDFAFGQPEYPDLTHFEHKLGFSYVIEGSTLGGQIVSKKMKEKFNFTTDDGTRFFSGQGVATGPRWRDFCLALENWAVGKETRHEKVVVAAVATFKTLEQWLCDGR